MTWRSVHSWPVLCFRAVSRKYQKEKKNETFMTLHRAPIREMVRVTFEENKNTDRNQNKGLSPPPPFTHTHPQNQAASGRMREWLPIPGVCTRKPPSMSPPPPHTHHAITQPVLRATQKLAHV